MAVGLISADPCSRSLAGVVGLNPAEVMDVCLVSSVCRQVEVSATGRALVQGRLAECVCMCVCVCV